MVAIPRWSGLKAAILIPLSGFVVVLVLAVLLGTYLNEREHNSGRLQLKIDQIEETLNHSIDKDVSKMSAALISLTQMEELKAPFLKRDREGLYSLSSGMFEELRTHNRITHFYFTEPDRTCFLRVHQPKRHGDRIDRYTTRLAEDTGQLGAGLGLGPLGTFSLRAVMPWRDQGRLIGYIELGEEIDHVLTEIRDVFGVKLFVFVSKKYLNQEDWEQGMRMLGRQPDWDRFQNVVLVNDEGSLPLEKLQRLVFSKSEKRSVLSEEKVGGGWFDLARIPLGDAATREVGYILTVEDITTQVLVFRKFMLTVVLLSLAGGVGLILLFWVILDRVEKRLARAEDRERQLGRILNSLSESVFIFNARSLAILEVNNGAKNKLGYTLEELQALSLEEIWKGQDAESIDTLLEPLRNGERGSLMLESVMRRKDSSTYPVEIYLEYFGSHTPSLFVAIAQDVSERKQAEEELRKAHEELGAIIDNSMMGFLFFNEAKGIVRINQRLADMFGYDPSELLGGGPELERLLAEAGSLRDEACLSKLCLGEAVEVERLMRHKDGSPIWCILSCKALTPSDIEAGVVYAFMDITGRKELDKLRADVERIVRHDLKTPLNGIINLPGLMLDDGDFTEEQTEFLKLIQEQGQRMLGMINRSLDLYKMETGTYQYQPKPVDSLDFVKRLLRDQAATAARKEVGLEGEVRGAPLDRAASLEIQIEELLAYSMLSNLLANAVEASPQGETVSLCVEEEDEWVVLTVHNMGAIPMGIRDTFFEKYATSGKTQGTGLGTYSAKLMAETMGGNIGFTTSEEEGTTITVRLPRG